MVNRRDFLVSMGSAGSIVAIAGCTGDTNNTNEPSDDESTDQDRSLYSQESKDSMLLSIDSFPDGWFRNDQFNDNFDAVYISEDETIVVLQSIEIYDNVSGAEERMETARAGVAEPHDYPIADDAFWASRNEFSSTLFRHLNAVGQSAASRQSGMELLPDPSRSQSYASDLFDNW